MKKVNVYKSMKSNKNNNKGGNSNLNKANLYYMKFVFTPKLNEENLIDYCNDKFLKDNKRLENYYQSFLNCCSAKATEEEQDYVYQTVLKFSNNMTGSLIDSKVPIIENKYQEMAKVDIEYIKRTKEYDKTCEKYVNEYILPIIKKLNDENKIVFDLDSKDKDIILKTENTLKILSILVSEIGAMSSLLKCDVIEFKPDIYKSMEKYYFLYLDDENIKQNMAQMLCNNFLNGYDKLDLMNIDNFNSADFYSIEGMDL